MKFGQQVKGRSVHALSWAGVSSSDDWESREKEVAVGLRSGVVELWNAQTRELTAQFDALSVSASLSASMAASAKPIDPSVRAPVTMNAGSKLVGMAVLQAGMTSVDGTGYERRLLTCANTGIVHVRPFSTLSRDPADEMEDIVAPAVSAGTASKKGAKGSSATVGAGSAAAAASMPETGSSSFSVGQDLCVLKVDPVSQRSFACGGKEHLLKIWDLETQTQSFKEKNVPHDMLNLRQQVWITSLAWVPGSGGHEVVTGTAYHQVRHYDTRLQKRPLFNVEVSDHAITCVDVSHDGRYLLVGDGGGRLQQLDLRKNARMVHVYHGMGGSVRGIESHPSLPMLGACGLDRFLRVYDVHTRKQLHKVYLKQKLNCVLFSAQTPAQAKEAEEAAADAEAAINAPAEDENDELWHELNQRAKRQAESTVGAGNGSGLYVKKRKAEEADDDDDVTSKKVKQEPIDSDDLFSASASGEAGEDDEDDEDAEDADEEDQEMAEDDEEDAEDAEEGEDDAEDDDEEEDDEEEEEVIPEPVATPARKTRASRAPVATPVSTRSTRSRTASSAVKRG